MSRQTITVESRSTLIRDFVCPKCGMILRGGRLHVALEMELLDTDFDTIVSHSIIPEYINGTDDITVFPLGPKCINCATKDETVLMVNVEHSVSKAMAHFILSDIKLAKICGSNVPNYLKDMLGRERGKKVAGYLQLSDAMPWVNNQTFMNQLAYKMTRTPMGMENHLYYSHGPFFFVTKEYIEKLHNEGADDDVFYDFALYLGDLINER